MVASQFGVVHQSRTDGRTEQLSDNLGRMTKLLGPDRERKKKRRRVEEAMEKTKRAREHGQKEKMKEKKEP